MAIKYLRGRVAVVRRPLALLFVLLLALLAAGCGGDEDEGANGEPAAVSCEKGDLNLVNEGQLTIGTDNPAFPPWFGGDEKAPWKVSDPRSGEGFESAVAYAVAEELGFSEDEVEWIHVPFNTAFAPGDKKFDFDINQISFRPERAKAVDFSDSYYNVNQAIVVLNGTEIANAKSRAELKPYELGAQLGTTSYQYIVDNIEPSQQPAVYDTNDGAVQALKNKQIDGLVVDLPTAFYVTAAQVENSKILGQFPNVGGGERFGMVFEKGNPLRQCVNQALATLREDGTLQDLQDEWLSKVAGAPVLK
jgi:polar amino acid transport system substrate-binding protein